MARGRGLLYELALLTVGLDLSFPYGLFRPWDKTLVIYTWPSLAQSNKDVVWIVFLFTRLKRRDAPCGCGYPGILEVIEREKVARLKK